MQTLHLIRISSEVDSTLFMRYVYLFLIPLWHDPMNNVGSRSSFLHEEEQSFEKAALKLFVRRKMVATIIGPHASE